MKEETIREICKENGLIDCEVFVKFFMRRFPDESDKIYSYCNEWINRFLSGNPTEYMDSDSLRIYKELI